MIHHIKRATRHLIFWSLISVAVGLTGVRLLLSGIEHYKVDLATHIGELVGTPVTIGRLGAKMRGFNPQLVLKDIAISSQAVPACPPLGAMHTNPPAADLLSASVCNNKPAIEFNEIRLGINVLDMLVKRDLLSSSWVTLVGAKLAIKRQQDGSIVIVGLKSSDGQPQWLLQGGKYEVLQSEISWQDETNHSRPLLFNGVDLAIRNDGERHRLNMLIKLPKKVGDTLRVSADFEGNVFEPATTQGSIYIEGKAVLLSELAAGFSSVQPAVCLNCRWLSEAEAGRRININSGAGDFKIWGDWKQSQLVSMDVAAHIKKLALVRQDKQEFFVNDLNTRLRLRANDVANDAGKQWQFDVSNFSLETLAGPERLVKKWPDAVFSVAGQRMNDNSLSEAALFVEQLDLQEVSELAQFFVPLPDEQDKILAKAQLKGALENLSLFADIDAKAIAINGRFTNISVAPLLSVPGIENLTGHIKGSEKQGAITFATKDAVLVAPDLFRESLPVRSLQGTLDWLQANDHWSVSSQAIELDSLSFQSKSQFRIDIPETDKPIFMDLQSVFAGEDASEVKHYLPVGIMDEEVVAWLDRAFVSGRMTNGGLLIYGNLNDFPFNTAPGIFEAVFNGEQFDLSFDPEWPHITGMNAEVMFSQEGLKVNILQGQSGIARDGVYAASPPGAGAAIARDSAHAASQSGAGAANVIIKQAEVTIPNLNESKHVLIQGDAEGEIDQVLAYMQQTPLSSPVDSLLESITPQGNTQVTLDLKIPLVDGAPTKVDGTAQLKDARLNVKSLDLPVSKINGKLKFNELGVYSDTIHAMALGHRIEINIESSDSQTTVNVEGNVGVEDLQKQFDMPWWKIAQGSADYRLKLELPYGDVAPELVVDSTLSGVSLDLPESLAKTREQSLPLLLKFSLGDKVLLPVLLNYDNKLKAAIQLDTEKRSLYSGHVVVGNGEAAQIQDAGLKLEINRDRLALQDWLGLATAQGAGDGVKELKIHSAHALWKKTDIGGFDLSLKHDGNYWTGTLASPLAKGSVQIPADFKSTDRISLDMELLDISALKQAAPKDTSAPQILSPEFMPLLTLTSQKTLWQSVDLGRLSLKTERIPGGMNLDQVELIGENQKLALSGDWRVSGEKTITHTQGHIEVPRFGQLLTQLGITKDMTETDAAIDFIVNWNAAPYQFSLEDLNGQVDVKLKNGRILSIEPGFGRILGMLALAQWIKRAQLDFSDVYQEGLTFNGIKGHFNLADGIASTHDLVVDAVPAKIAISGDTDLVNQSVDHIVDVTPKSADAVPIAGTIMGKVAALVGRSLTGKDQEGFFFGSQYLVKGAWGNAEIIPMHKNDGLLQKTWNGITDFPWLQQQEEQ
ncbi:DUF3971 domain-containing protein [Methylobacter sp.]|uniref:YhdP family phospholipid transporter n=1 Tax=Methylobacter sp. TaxID=2051955 RepID=UPI00120F3411|nr:DUF3971 domain-containing protein [Methylobacter sp.]TAK63594.1 MAG: TIGR02099 family protein [Methylobacter sp.]